MGGANTALVATSGKAWAFEECIEKARRKAVWLNYARNLKHALEQRLSLVFTGADGKQYVVVKSDFHRSDPNLTT